MDNADRHKRYLPALRWRFAACNFLGAMLLLAGCAATRIDMQWTNPESAVRKISGKLLVVGLTQDDTMRRVYEDEMAARLATRGVNAVRSYEVVQGAFGSDGNKAIVEAARRAGATTVLTSAVVGHEHIRAVTIDEPVPRWHGAYEGWYSYYWPYLYRRAEVRVIERYMASTSLIDVASGRIDWTARTHTDATSDVDHDIKEFAGVIFEALGKSVLM
jgi:hypothetical protein